MKPLKTKIDFGIGKELKPDYTNVPLYGMMTSGSCLETASPKHEEFKIGDILSPPTTYSILESGEKPAEGFVMYNLINPFFIQIPNCVMHLVKATFVMYLSAGFQAPRHRDPTRAASLYFPYHPEEDYTPMTFDDHEIKNDGNVHLIDNQEWHWVDNREGPDRYNIQITIDCQPDEAAIILKENGLA